MNSSPTNNNPSSQKCGFVALIGAPNAGKSTLLNTLMGAKISIVTHKAQTTRDNITALETTEDQQLIIVDTPGLIRKKRDSDRAMIQSVCAQLETADEIVLLVDAARSHALSHTEDLLEHLRLYKRTAILALNKIDLIKRSKLLKLADEFYQTNLFHDVFMISASTGNGVKDLKACLKQKLPERDFLYDKETSTILPKEFMAAETTREKLFLEIHEEIPYVLTVEPVSWKDTKKMVTIHQTIIVPELNQKKIILGKKGTKIKQIGTESRKELEKTLKKKVNLQLFVKVSTQDLKK